VTSVAPSTGARCVQRVAGSAAAEDRRRNKKREPTASTSCHRAALAGADQLAPQAVLNISTEAAGRVGDGRKRITSRRWERRTGPRLRFIYRRGAPSLLIADNARLTSRGRAARKKGRRAGASFSRLAGRTTVPIFVLVPQATLKKRLDVEGAGRRWIGRLAADLASPG
jgi:Family of unknown function (DUF6441)